MSTKHRIASVLLITGSAALAAMGFIPARTIVVIPEPPQREKTNVEIITEVARANEIEPIHLYGIAAQESSFGKFKQGDSGCSIGWFHINLCAHAEAKEIVGDLRKETEWVADTLNDLGYQKDSRRAIARYNRPADPNFRYADLVEKRIAEIDKFIGSTDR